MTVVPSRIVVVRAATHASKSSEADTCPRPLKWCSTRKLESNPSASASTHVST
jgi:hypothetical protein